MDNYSEEIVKHKKKTGSNVSKIKNKSNHKHIYKECLIQYDFNFNMKTVRHTVLGSYCEICGKVGGKVDNSIVGNTSICETRPDGSKYYSHISGEVLFENYKDKMPVFLVDDCMAKFVKLE